MTAPNDFDVLGREPGNADPNTDYTWDDWFAEFATEIESGITTEEDE